jgi:hypothetical protein
MIDRPTIVHRVLIGISVEGGSAPRSTGSDGLRLAALVMQPVDETGRIGGEFMRLICLTIAYAILVSGLLADEPKPNFEDSKIQIAKKEVENLTKAVEYFQKKQGAFPAKLKDLQDVGYVEPGKLLKDPWGKEYQYDRAGKKNGGKKPDIWFVAPDGKKIGNWPEEKPKADDAEKVKRAEADVHTIEDACKVYKLKFGEYPSTLELFLKPPSGQPFFENSDALLDSWGHKFQYDPKGPKNGGNKPDVWAVTPNGKTIGNWPENATPSKDSPPSSESWE